MYDKAIIFIGMQLPQVHWNIYYTKIIYSGEGYSSNISPLCGTITPSSWGAIAFVSVYLLECLIQTDANKIFMRAD